MFMFCGSSSVRQFQRDFAGKFSYNVFSGASIQGLMRAQSAVGHGQIIRHMARAPQRKKLFLMLGNADTDFGFYKKLCETPSLDAEAFADERVEVYNRFLTSLLDEDVADDLVSTIGVLGLQPSPLRDTVFASVVASHTGAAEAALRQAGERIDLGHAARIARVVAFNDRLEAGLIRHDKLRYFRIDHAMLDAGGGLLDRFYPAQPREHHASKNETFRLWRDALAPEVAAYIRR